ncbi:MULTISPECIES: NAD(P)/FAD-dependent oxidoreductase [Commensalibacter]|uniref:NAD(P)/FAD-dependent oxidoreductase n=1 Tax=Commensalibacter TaxID=1079922 RepID=UPI0018DBD8D5|nr:MULTISPECIES: FAD-dependent oxidoreductase [Commensalibacter]MBH9973844.1 FAD-dependent monooxygenase [Commensalibacter melissae]MBI0017494.1 FAD-dependent monooxygenase [Commensalibacter sp. B14384M2]MBI0019240.1 FAD-dependent monooxygenase [Commensalibacter sp. W8133]MBI0050399.1 FAD-dependent monooxygenase [Commensalibacter sp. B14384M3]MBI0180070.1 FAD-dependent monooxygenase [Commensalibacter sp. W8163]
MIRVTEVKLPLDHDEADLKQALYNRLKQFPSEYQVIRRGYDARRRGDIQLVYTIDCSIDNEEEFLRNHSLDRNLSKTPEVRYQFVMSRQTGEKIASQASYVRPIVIGAGPCGFMAGLLLAQMGLRPLILERGKAVRERTVDTFAFWRQSKFNPDSNVQYGEGGAGTFSDGKLHTQISDPYHYGHKVLTEFVRAGAPEEILYVSKPHIGTFRLVSMVEKIRQEIESFGGQYRFNTYVQKILMNKNRQIVGVRLVDGQEIQTNHIILATGHSAREMMYTLYEDGVEIQAKPFSVGVRIEHPQTLIDKVRFGSQAGHQLLGAADYKLVHHDADKRGVYSFCMCPGGTVIAAASEERGIVTNGMSQYSRAERNANAAIVVGVKPERDYAGHPLAGIDFQRDLERKAFQLGGANYKAPVQRVEDFLLGRATRTLGSVVPSYKPGVEPDDLAEILPSFVINGIREALPAFNRKLSGFNFADAVMTGVETRTSSPVRIPRMDDGQSVNTSGLYPAGEGAGYAGGIMSAAIDGIKIAEKVAQNIHDNHQ